MSFQITILKVLAGHPDGRASLAEFRRAVAILISSGTDWTNRRNRLAARAPGLDIFAQALVLRDDTGWQITDAGRALLASVEIPIPTTTAGEQAKEFIVTVTPIPASPPIRLVGVNRRMPRRRVPNACDRPPRKIECNALERMRREHHSCRSNCKRSRLAISSTRL